MTGLTVGGEDAVDRILAAVAQEASIGEPFGVTPPTPLQVAMVLRAACTDHTTLERARVYDRSERHGVGETFHPSSASIGRFYFAVADSILTAARLA